MFHLCAYGKESIKRDPTSKISVPISAESLHQSRRTKSSPLNSCDVFPAFQSSTFKPAYFFFFNNNSR